MKKNVASQSIGAQMVTAADGTAFTGAVSVLVTLDNGTQTSGAGTAPAHEGNGYHSYTPTQAETNGDHIAFTFTGTGAIPATVQVYTGFPQTGDNFARLGAPAGASVSADVAAVKSDTAAVLVDTGTSGVIVATNNDKTGYSISGTKTTLDDLNDIAATAIVSSGAITTLAGAVVNVDTVDTCTNNTDMRGTDNALLAASYTAPDNAGIAANGTAIAGLNDFNPATDAVANVTTTGTVTNRVTANVDQIGGNAAAAGNLRQSALGIVQGTVTSGTSTTVFADTSLSALDDFYIGRIVVFLTGTLAGQATDIADYTGSTGTITVTALTGTPSIGDTYVIL